MLKKKKLKLVSVLLCICVILTTGCSSLNKEKNVESPVSDEQDFQDRFVEAFDGLSDNKELAEIIEMLSESELKYYEYANGIFDVVNNDQTLTVSPIEDIYFMSEGSSDKLCAVPLNILFGDEELSTVCYIKDGSVKIVYVDEALNGSVPIIRYGDRYLLYPNKLSGPDESSFVVIDTLANDGNEILTPADIAKQNGLTLPGEFNSLVEPVIIYPDEVLPMVLYTCGEDETAKSSITYIVRYHDGKVVMEIDTPELDKKLGLINE